LTIDGISDRYQIRPKVFQSWLKDFRKSRDGTANGSVVNDAAVVSSSYNSTKISNHQSKGRKILTNGDVDDDVDDDGDEVVDDDEDDDDDQQLGDDDDEEGRDVDDDDDDDGIDDDSDDLEEIDDEDDAEIEEDDDDNVIDLDDGKYGVLSITTYHPLT